MNEELAVIEDINIGNRDAGYPICWFTVSFLGGHSLQIISIAEMEEMIKAAQCYRLSDLNNKPCVISRGNGLVKFLRLHK